MATEKLDRRVRRTRKLLAQSLTELLEEKELKDITVKEVSEHADLNRGTFYLHYKDVYDMMEQIQKELFEDFNDILSKNACDDTCTTPYNLLCQVFLFLNDNKAICKVLTGPHGDYHFIQSLKWLVKEHMERIWIKNQFKIENLEIYYNYSISGILGVIQFWLEGNNDKSPLEMATIVNDLMVRELALFT